ncbi:Crp/Fnr family transcriptional regulator [Aquimarina sediminis]|uniref:Crp/Fnr family transcriptional regulator n=1 Tax=Aquimarina sediminis TaxID=2070536 RepID=UPI000CA03E0C|nr:Crp/Fnr family transcriptional regulator [Aquimarina sediminis]
MKQLITFITQLSTLDRKAKEELSEITKLKTVSKGDFLISSNTYCRELFFIKKGIVKMQFNSNGNEFIMRFFEENILFTDIESCNLDKHSRYEIIAIEDTELYVIPFSKFENLCLKHHSLETFYRKFLTIANLNMMARIKEMLEEDAKKRYENFLRNHPSLAQRINLGDLSKYIGITQVSLSRIRAIK